MSPEQARGMTVDKRSDIWAFGVVLYEMLTRRRLFHGESMTDTLAAVLSKEPEWNRVPAKARPDGRGSELSKSCASHNAIPYETQWPAAGTNSIPLSPRGTPGRGWFPPSRVGLSRCTDSRWPPRPARTPV